MFILGSMLTCASLGGLLGTAVATLTEASEATCTAVGILGGAAVGAAVGLAESEYEDCEA